MLCFSLTSRQMPEVLRSFNVLLPDVPCYNFLIISAVRALIKLGTGLADGRITFKLPVTVAVGGGIWKYMVVWKNHTIVVCIVNIVITFKESGLRHRSLVGSGKCVVILLYFFAYPRSLVACIHGSCFDRLNRTLFILKVSCCYFLCLELCF